MIRNEWLDRWLDAQIHEIEKVDQNLKEKYTELSNKLHSIELDLISTTAEVQELRATIDSLSNDQTATTIQFTDLIRQNSDNILKHSVICPHPESWNLVWNRLSELEKSEHKREGSGKWEGLIINAIITVFVTIIIAIILYFMSGGRITS